MSNGRNVIRVSVGIINYFLSKALKLALEATKLLIQLDTEALTEGLRQMGREADQLSLSKINVELYLHSLILLRGT